MPGPIPKRDAERRRRNKNEVATTTVDIDALVKEDVEIPVPPTKWVEDEDSGEKVEVSAWHPTAEHAYWSLARSGQAIFMEPSDWATAYALCEALSRELNPKPLLVHDGEGASHIEWVIQPLNGAVLSSFLKGWASLMATEGDRRKLRIELERKKAKDAAIAGDGVVVSITQNREDVFKRQARG